MNTENVRRDMPQIDDNSAAEAWLINRGVSFSYETVLTNRLKPTQRHGADFDRAQFNASSAGLPVWVSSDNFIIDGHHRVAFARYSYQQRINVIRIHLPVSEALPLMQNETTMVEKGIVT